MSFSNVYISELGYWTGADGVATASLYYAAPAEKVVCGASQQPVHLSTTVSQLTLQIVPQYATTPGETFAQTGLSWSATRP